MYKNTIGTSVENSEKISDKIEQITFNSIRKVLPDKAIEDACDATGYRYRRRVITPIVTVLHMILAAIWHEESFTASWQVLWTSFSSRFSDNAGKSPSLGSAAKARYRLPVELWKNLFEWVSQQSQKLSQTFDNQSNFEFCPCVFLRADMEIAADIQGYAHGNWDTSCPGKARQKRTASRDTRTETLPQIEKHTRTMEESLCSLRKRHSYGVPCPTSLHYRGSSPKLSLEQMDVLDRHFSQTTYLRVQDIVAYVESTFGVFYTIQVP